MGTKKPATLEDYINKYLTDNPELTNPKSYAEFLMHGGRGANVVEALGRTAAENKYSHSPKKLQSKTLTAGLSPP